jgi:hypothetical protein
VSTPVLEPGDIPRVDQEVPPHEPRRVGFPRKTATPTAKKATAKVPASKPGEFVEPMEQLYTMISLGVDMVDKKDHGNSEECSKIILDEAHNIAVKWDELAQKNDQVRKTLRTLTQGSAWGSLLMAHVPIALAVFATHMPGSVPASIINKPEPEAEPQPQRVVKRVPPSPKQNVAANTIRSGS